MRRYRVLLNGPDAFFAALFRVDCITNTAGSDMRQAQDLIKSSLEICSTTAASLPNVVSVAAASSGRLTQFSKLRTVR
jgi:hypothetical protein